MPDIFLSYSRDDQATARRFADGFEQQGFNVWWDVTKLGRHEEACDAIRQLRAAEPSLSLEGIERANTLVFAPEAAQDMNATLRKVWLDSPLESSGT